MSGFEGAKECFIPDEAVDIKNWLTEDEINKYFFTEADQSDDSTKLLSPISKEI